MLYAFVRKDLADQEELPALMTGWPSNYLEMGEELYETGFCYAYLDDESLESVDGGFNMTIWSPNCDLVDLANSIDWDFENPTHVRRTFKKEKNESNNYEAIIAKWRSHVYGYKQTADDVVKASRQKED